MAPFKVLSRREITLKAPATERLKVRLAALSAVQARLRSAQPFTNQNRSGNDSFVLILFTAAKVKGVGMRPTVSPAEEAEIYETVRREQPQIERVVARMLKQLKGLADVSQKQAISQILSGWIMGVYPDNKEMALLLSEHMREQVDIYLNSIMDDEKLH
jgi:hypothetical protein